MSVLATVCGVAVAALQYAWIGSNTPPTLFGSWADSFYDGEHGFRPVGVATWAAERLVLLLRAFVPMARDPAWDGSLIAVSFDVLCLTGLVAALVRFAERREWWLMALLVGPLLPPFVLGVVGRWPFGPERVNLFATTPLLLIVLLGWEALLRHVDHAWTLPAFAALFVVLQLPLDVTGLHRKDVRYGVAQEDITAALDEMESLEPVLVSGSGPRPALICNGMSGYAMRYYLDYEESCGPRFRALLYGRRADWVPTRQDGGLGTIIRRRLRELPAAWVLLSHYREADLTATRAALADPEVEILLEREFSGVMLFGARLKTQQR